MLEPTIYAPAEPKTRESRAPIFMMALWTIDVSYFEFFTIAALTDYGFFAIYITCFIIF
jgi:hypothetical protein